MSIYYVVFGILVLGSLYENIIPRTKSSNLKAYTCFLLLSAVMVAFRGFRWNTGTDWYPYYEAFNEISITDIIDPTKNLTYYERGFSALNLLIRALFGSYTIYLLIFNVIIIGLYSREILRSTLLYSTILLVLYVSRQPFPVRQILATAIVVYGYRFAIRRELIKFILIVIIASTIHRTAIAALPIYLLAHRKLNNGFVLAVYLSCLIIGNNSELISKAMVSVLNIIYGDNIFIRKLVHYVNESTEYSLLIKLRVYIKQISFLVFFMFVRAKYAKNIKDYDFYFNLMVVYFALNALFLESADQLSRISTYYVWGEYVMLVMLLQNMSMLYKYYALPIFYIYMLFRYSKGLDKYSDLYFPYISIFHEHLYRHMY